MSVVHVKNREGEYIALIPLGEDGTQGNAKIFKDDLLALDAIGLSLRWSRNPKNGHVRAPSTRHPSHWVSPARVLLGAGENERVTFKDNDPTNLLRPNLVLRGNGKAKHRDRDFVRPVSFGDQL